MKSEIIARLADARGIFGLQVNDRDWRGMLGGGQKLPSRKSQASATLPTPAVTREKAAPDQSPARQWGGVIHREIRN
jgi:hypothetical protein